MDPDRVTSARLYAATRQRVSTAVRNLRPSDLNRQVPACPEWTVHNLVSHLAGVAGGAVDGRTGLGTPRSAPVGRRTRHAVDCHTGSHV